MAKKSRQPAAEPVAAAPSNEGGLGVNEGIVLTTTILLILAVWLVYSATQKLS